MLNSIYIEIVFLLNGLINLRHFSKVKNKQIPFQNRPIVTEYMNDVTER